MVAQIGIVLLVLLILIFNQQGFLRLRELRRQQTELEQEIELLREEHVSLEAEKEKLAGDMAYIEQLARERYFMVKRGEKVYRIEPLPHNQPETP